jgi:pimeloyl-ACP methyl ester carboxylesterase
MPGMTSVDVAQIQVSANGIDQNVLVCGPADGTPVLLIHGNCSSASFWAPLLRHLPGTLRVVAPDLRGYGTTKPAPVDATRGLRDFADDVAALLDRAELFGRAGARPVVVGHSMGGGVAMQLLVDHPDRVAGLLLEAPLSPYGFGGTCDTDGTPTSDDFAGTGGAAGNPEFVRLLAAGDRGAGQLSPRTLMRTMYVADPAVFGDDEELLLDSVLSTVTGEDNYPGDSTASDNWPGAGPGRRGVLNAMSPRWFNLAGQLVAVPAPKPPVVWVRGDADAIVSDTSMFDLAQLGRLGAVPGWPGEQSCPPQPMVSQTRAVLERYAAAGGDYREVCYPGVGHSPHVERPAEFATELRHLAG